MTASGKPLAHTPFLTLRDGCNAPGSTTHAIADKHTATAQTREANHAAVLLASLQTKNEIAIPPSALANGAIRSPVVKVDANESTIAALAKISQTRPNRLRLCSPDSADTIRRTSDPRGSVTKASKGPHHAS